MFRQQQRFSGHMLLTLLLIFVWFSSQLHAQWPTTPEEDLMVAYSANSIDLAAPEKGGVWVAMTGATNEYYLQTFLQRVTPRGYLVFDSAKSVAGSEDLHTGADMVPDGHGGIYLVYYTAVFLEYPHWYNAATRLQHYDSTGTPLWNQNGVLLIRQDSTAYSSPCYAVTDSAGGVIVVWYDYRQSTGQGDWDVYAQRYNTDGIALWDSGGVLVTTRHQTPTQIFPDQQGGVIIRAGEWFYYLDAQGELAWDSTELRTIFWFDKIASLTSGDLAGVNQTLHNPNEYPDFKYGLLTNELTIDGEWVLPGPGVNLIDTLLIRFPGSLRYELAPITPTKVFYIWQARYINSDRYTNGLWIQILDMDGGSTLPGGGMQVSGDTTAYLQKIIPGKLGSVITFFKMGADRSLFAQRIDSLGQTTWGDSAVRITTHDRSVIDLVSDGHGGAILATGNGSLKQISANGNLGEVITHNYPEPSFPLPEKVWLGQNYPNPFNSSTLIPYFLEIQSHVEIAIYNIQGQQIQILLNKKQPRGHYTVRWNGHTQSGAPAPSGIYFIRIHTEKSNVSPTRKLVLVR